MQTPSVEVDEALDEVYFVDGFDAKTPVARIVDIRDVASFCITETIATRNAILREAMRLLVPGLKPLALQSDYS